MLNYVVRYGVNCKIKRTKFVEICKRRQCILNRRNITNLTVKCFTSTTKHIEPIIAFYNPV